MRKMFSKNQIKELAVESVNAGIQSGEISLDLPIKLFPLSVEGEYQLAINTDETYIYIIEDSDNFEILKQIIGMYLYGWDADDNLICKGLIVSGNANEMLDNTYIKSSDTSLVTYWEIGDK